MSRTRVKIFRCLYLIVIAPIYFPVAGLLCLCELVADFFNEEDLLDAWNKLFLKMAYRLFPYEHKADEEAG